MIFDFPNQRYIYISDTGGGDKGRGWCIARRVWLVGCPLSGWRGGRGEVEVHVAQGAAGGARATTRDT